MQQASRYLSAWIWSTFALLLTIALVNVVIDPYGLFHVVDAPGVNRIKSQASERGLLFKRAGVERMRPNALVLGNSRAEIGFDPESAVWPASVRPAYNLGIPGSGIGAVAHEFARTLRIGTPKLVIVGLDFVDFRVDPSSDDRFSESPPGADRLSWVRDRASAILTMNAFLDSLATVKAQHETYPTGLTSAGFNPKQDYVGIAKREGYYAMFRQRDQENAGSYTRGPKSIYQAGGRPGPGFGAVENIIALARTNGVQLRLIIYPYHAHTLMLFHLADLWPAYEDWKRELTKRVDNASRTMDIELWDFTGFSPYATERVPRPGDTTTEVEWYWEAGHFKKSLGDRVLARLFGVYEDDDTWGCPLNGSNLEQHLREQRAEREHYERDHPDDVRELAALVTMARSR